jgi:hypothetical protein
MGSKNQTMKQCMDAQAAKASGMSKAAMTKACDEQMKMQKDRAHTPKNDDGSPTTTPK